MPFNHQQTFQRFELKYVVPLLQKEKMLKELRPFLKLDPHTEDDELGYGVSSLYYDSSSLRCYHEKVEGESHRAKLRLRRYSHMAKGLCSLEIKKKLFNSVSKRRTFIPSEQAMHWLHLQKSMPTLNALCRENKTVQEALFLIHLYRMKPTTVINYSRLAFEGLFHHRLRITFDSDLRAQSEELVPGSRVRGTLQIPIHYCVMEVKYNVTLPRFVSQVLKKYNHSLQKLSKYCSGVEAIQNQSDRKFLLSRDEVMQKRMQMGDSLQKTITHLLQQSEDKVPWDTQNI